MMLLEDSEPGRFLQENNAPSSIRNISDKTMQYFQVPQAVSFLAYFWIGSLVHKLHLLRMQPESNGSWCFETCQDMPRHASIDHHWSSEHLKEVDVQRALLGSVASSLGASSKCGRLQLRPRGRNADRANRKWFVDAGLKKPSELLGMCWGLLIFLGSRSQDSLGVKACMSKPNEHLSFKIQ